MSGASQSPNRENVHLVLEWNPITGQFSYEADGANLMEQMGMLVFAAITVYGKKDGAGALVIPSGRP